MRVQLESDMGCMEPPHIDGRRLAMLVVAVLGGLAVIATIVGVL